RVAPGTRGPASAERSLPLEIPLKSRAVRNVRGQSDNPRRLPLPITLADTPLVKLAVRVAGQVGIEFDGARAFVRGEVCPAIRDQFGLDFASCGHNRPRL